jgi:undecaprenyl-diphosphatase
MPQRPIPEGPLPQGPISQRLLPQRLHAAAFITLAACVVTVGVLSALFYHGSAPDSLDNAVFSWVWPHHVGLAPVAALGGPVPVTLVTAVLCYCCLALRRYRGAIMLAISVVVASGITELLKHLIRRIYIDFLSFPSGHTTATFALVTCIAVLLIDPPATKAPVSMRIVLALLAFGFACTVALGLVAAKWHYFTDTIGGAAVGVGVTIALALALDRAGARRDQRRAASVVPAETAPTGSGRRG